MNSYLPGDIRNSISNVTILVSILFLYFLGKMLFFALNIGTNISPDEITWIGLSQIFSRTLLLPIDSPESYQFGLITHIPYLYPWLMGKALHLNFFNITDLVFLRLLNVCIGLATLWFAWKTIRLLSQSTITRILFVLMCTNTLMLTFLNSFVSYDNLVNFLAVAALYFLFMFFEKRSVSHLLLSAIFILAGCLTKMSFLPFAILVLIAFIFREYRQLGTLSRELGNCFLFRNMKHSALMALCILFLVLNLDLHLRNLIEHRTLTVSVENVLGLENAMQNRIFARNYIMRQYRAGELSLQDAQRMAATVIKHEKDRSDTMHLLNYVAREKMQASPQRLDRFRYAFLWTDMMLGKTFGVMGHKDMEKRNVALVPYMLVMLVAMALMIRKFSSRDLGGNAGVLLLVVIGYTTILMQYVNYGSYQNSGVLILAVQGRYLFPVLFAAYALMAHYLTSFNSKRWNVAISIAVASLFLIGEFPWFLSHVTPDWYLVD